ncbi:MAG: hypothetical protein ACYCXZ_09480 [Coriobacteriia bacterium]
MAKTIGKACDFYRMRVMTVDTTGEVDIEWRDDILYRRPPSTVIEVGQVHRVEAVLLDDDEVTFALAGFAAAHEAHDWMREREDDLREMTKSEFETAFFPEVRD